jgi:hypothetical protein
MAIAFVTSKVTEAFLSGDFLQFSRASRGAMRA